MTRASESLHFSSTAPLFELRSATWADRIPIYRMLDLYQHDLSDIWDQDLDAHGEYGYLLDEYFEQPESRACVITVEGRYAGFALVVPRPVLPGAQHWLEQYFIVKKYRRRGIGKNAAMALFDALPGQWQVGQMPRNHAGQAFWREVIRSYTRGNYTESTVTTDDWQGVLQQFSSPGC